MSIPPYVTTREILGIRTNCKRGMRYNSPKPGINPHTVGQSAGQNFRRENYVDTDQ